MSVLERKLTFKATCGESFQVVMLGEGAVGKSSVTLSYIKGYFTDDYDPTIEDSYQKLIKVDDRISEIKIQDTAGQEEYKCLRDQYIRQGDGFMLVYSVTDESSFIEVRETYEQILRVKDTEGNVPVVLVANKTDLKNQRVITTEHGAKLASELGLAFYETSAKAGTNIDLCFSDLIRQMRILKPKEVQQRNLKGNKNHNKKACCTVQ